MAHHKRHKTNPKHNSYEIRDTSYRAGRAYAMHKKREPLDVYKPLERAVEEVILYGSSQEEELYQ